MDTDKTFVPENLYATTSGIAGRTIALTRWSVSQMMETVIVLMHDDDYHHDNDEEGDHDRHYNDEEGIINKKDHFAKRFARDRGQ